MGLDIYKSDRCVLTKENGIEYYTIDGLKHVQKEMLQLLKIVDQICSSNNISYWIDGGSLIGAVRHHGFIPWDDDIDISLSKPDYLRLIPLLENYSNMTKGTYLYYSSNETNYHCCNFFASTKSIYSRFKGSLTLMPIKLDIRPANVFRMDDFNENENKKMRDLANLFIFNRTYIYKDLLSNKLTKEQYISEKNKFLTWYNKEYGIEKPHEGTVFTHPYFEFSKPLHFVYEDIFPLKRIQFENLEISVPNNVNKFLSYFYNDFMKLPILDQRAPAAYEYIHIPETYNEKAINVLKGQLKCMYKTKSLSYFCHCIRLYGLKKFLMIVIEKMYGQFTKSR